MKVLGGAARSAAGTDDDGIVELAISATCTLAKETALAHSLLVAVAGQREPEARR